MGFGDASVCQKAGGYAVRGGRYSVPARNGLFRIGRVHWQVATLAAIMGHRTRRVHLGWQPAAHSRAGGKFATEFQQLWLAAPIGLFSLADTFGDPEVFSDEARAHSSFYAVRAAGRMDREIFPRIILRSSKTN